MKFYSDPKSNWKRMIFYEKVLDGLTNRQRAEIETDRDLIKPVQQLVCDVHEEIHDPKKENEWQAIAAAQKRTASLMARIAISNDRLSRKIFWLTVMMTILTFAIGIMTYI